MDERSTASTEGPAAHSNVAVRTLPDSGTYVTGTSTEPAYALGAESGTSPGSRGITDIDVCTPDTVAEAGAKELPAMSVSEPDIRIKHG